MNILSVKVRTSLIYVTILTMIIATFMHVNKANAAQSKFSGEEIFLGIAFGQGEVGKLFPELWDSLDEEELNSQEAKEFTSSAIEKIKEQDPTYFDDLQSAVYSNDIQQIDKVIVRGYPLLSEAFEDSGLKSDEVGDVVGQCVVVLFAAVAIGTAAYQHQYVYSHESFWTTSSASINSNQLAKEQFIVNIVERL
jgi:SdpC family antimicrobial peptide